jgi:hypothetical protein
MGIIALFGYSELRATTIRKTEEDLVRIIKRLRKVWGLASSNGTSSFGNRRARQIYGR